MATVTITLSDGRADELEVKVDFGERGADVNSNAHVMALEIVRDLREASDAAIEELADQHVREGLFAPHKPGEIDD